MITLKHILVILLVAIVIMGFAAGVYGKVIEIETPYILGDEIKISLTQIGIVRGICINENEIFYRIENKANHIIGYLTLDQIKKQEKKESQKRKEDDLILLLK